MKLLLIEDVSALASLTRKALEDEGFRVDVAGSAREAEDALAVEQPDVIVLDLGLPDEDGLVLLSRLRKLGRTTPILVVTARAGLNQRIDGLDRGADDYLGKPAAPAEIAARCRALLRRPGGLLGGRLSLANVELDTAGRTVAVADRYLPVARREVDVLEALLRRAGTVVPRQVIEAAIYTMDETPGPNALEASISRLRKLLAESDAAVVIHVVRGVGYMVAAKPR
ncbi:putative two-component response regulator (QseB/CopT-like) [Bosea sp. LC85]|uniref:response regulator n=1 Tax=Bosea sp. LC85 TaxID=1502851 RepID=UPI0004E33FF5|nr:response regulator transcription factor [Bosea sp. LC85]KFC75427.1 putative two-component response regulator (QseB/CopT-like) [Bosea sp. LC85]